MFSSPLTTHRGWTQPVSLLVPWIQRRLRTGFTPVAARIIAGFPLLRVYFDAMHEEEVKGAERSEGKKNQPRRSETGAKGSVGERQTSP